MKLPGTYADLKLKLDVAALIDVVFLLLIYFMVTASLIRSEADMGFKLPAPDMPPMTDIPVEVIIEIQPDGRIELEGIQFSGSDAELKDLSGQIAGLKKIAAAQGSEFFINLLPHQEATHRRIIDVMDACSKAGVDSLVFSKSI